MKTFDNWFSQYLFHHRVLALEVEILPGVKIRDIVIEVAKAAWDESDKGSSSKSVIEETRKAPAIHLVTTPVQPSSETATTKPRSGIQSYWDRMTPEQRKIEADKRFGNRRGHGKGGKKTKSDDELMKIAEVLESSN